MTESADTTQWSIDEPTVCPNNIAHTIDPTLTTIIGQISTTDVTVREENGVTGGNFATACVVVTATRNTTTTADITFPFPISALMVEYITGTEHAGDSVSMLVGPDTTIGVIAAAVTPASAWTAGTYQIGQIVTYIDARHGTRTYTCTASTTTIPTNTAYWTHGHELFVTPTVLTYTMPGYLIGLTDGTNTDSRMRVVSVNRSRGTIYVEGPIAHQYAAYVTACQRTVAVIRDHRLSVPWAHRVGESKIGGAYVPADVTIRIEYVNRSTDQDKTLVGRVEYLY